MKWRNAEGREFPAEVFHGRDIAKVGHFALSAHAMRSLGYELVEDSPSDSVSATQVGAPSANDESVRLSQVPSETLAQFCYELVGKLDQADRDGARANWRHILYDALAPLVVGEFEVVCEPNESEDTALTDVRLIPGKTYVVREKR